MALQFGELPLYIGKLETGEYEVSDQSLDIADTVGVNQVFPPERMEIMKARAYAHGYILVEVEIPTEEATSAPATPQFKVPTRPRGGTGNGG